MGSCWACGSLGMGLGARPGERITRSRWPFWTHLRANPLFGISREKMKTKRGAAGSLPALRSCTSHARTGPAPWGCRGSWCALRLRLFVPLSGERHHTEHSGFEGRRALVMRSPGRAPKSIPSHPPATQLPQSAPGARAAPHGAHRPGERITRARRPRPSPLDSLLLPASYPGPPG